MQVRLKPGISSGTTERAFVRDVGSLPDLAQEATKQIECGGWQRQSITDDGRVEISHGRQGVRLASWRLTGTTTQDELRLAHMKATISLMIWAAFKLTPAASRLPIGAEWLQFRRADARP